MSDNFKKSKSLILILTKVKIIFISGSIICCVRLQSPSDMMPKRDHERDLELDKKIEALRRKNEVLMKRYKVEPVPAGRRVEVELDICDILSILLHVFHAFS